MSRAELRKHIFMLLFRVEFNPREEMPEQEELYLEEIGDISEDDRTYIIEKYEAVLARVEEIDKMIDTFAIGWKTTRMNRVDLTILRLAVYEMKWDEEVPTKVAINEAVEISKRFSGDEGPSFINGVLAKLAN